jgi:uncharacterized RDD family membrane protein YckC
MRCPKCHYLSFEPEARCRNCGYDFALAENDLVIKAVDDDEGPMQDFDLRVPSAVMPPAPPPMTLGLIHPEPPIPAAAVESPKPEPPLRVMTSVVPARETRPPVAAVPPPLVRPSRPPSTTTELPLFMQGLSADHSIDAPLVQVPASPRPPLSVRRRSPDLSSDVIRPDRNSHVEMAAHVDSVWAPLPADREREDETTPAASNAAREAAGEDDLLTDVDLGAAARATAAAVDLLVLGGIDAIVLWLTARICGIGFGAVLTLPFVPLIAFFLLVDVGYLFLFTATSGQTLGKMTAGLRVVPEDDASEQAPLSMRQAIVRALATVPSVIALGAGFLPALAGRGLAVHDRLAHTRVVRA